MGGTSAPHSQHIHTIPPAQQTNQTHTPFLGISLFHKPAWGFGGVWVAAVPFCFSLPAEPVTTPPPPHLSLLPPPMTAANSGYTTRRVGYVEIAERKRPSEIQLSGPARHQGWNNTCDECQMWSSGGRALITPPRKRKRNHPRGASKRCTVYNILSRRRTSCVSSWPGSVRL